MPKGIVVGRERRSCCSDPCSQEPLRRPRVVDEQADHVAPVVDVDGCRGRGIGDVEGGETAVAPDEAVRRPAGVHEVAHDITTIVDADGQGVHGVGCVDPGGLAPVTDVAAHSGAVVDERGVLAVAAHDLAAIVDLDRLGSPGAGHIERGDPAARVPHEPGLAVGSDVLTGDVAAVVDAAREDLDPGVRRLELAVPTLSEDEPRRGAARPVRGRRTHRRPGRRERGGGDDRSREDACDTVGAAPAAEPGHDGFPSGRAGVSTRACSEPGAIPDRAKTIRSASRAGSRSTRRDNRHSRLTSSSGRRAGIAGGHAVHRSLSPALAGLPAASQAVADTGLAGTLGVAAEAGALDPRTGRRWSPGGDSVAGATARRSSSP